MQEIFDFLERLQGNNSKEWMDEHRDEYHQVRRKYMDWLNELDRRLQKKDPDYIPTDGKAAIHRINNNLMFHPDKPVYKDHFGATMDRVKAKSDFYIHLGLTECFIAGGYYHPPSQILAAIREAIDYNGEKLRAIVDDARFKKQFGELLDDDALKTAPKGYDRDHPQIELLRLKSFAVMHEFTRKEVCQPDFIDKAVELYEIMMPFRNYLNEAVSFSFEI